MVAGKLKVPASEDCTLEQAVKIGTTGRLSERRSFKCCYSCRNLTIEGRYRGCFSLHPVKSLPQSFSSVNILFLLCSRSTHF